MLVFFKQGATEGKHLQICEYISLFQFYSIEMIYILSYKQLVPYYIYRFLILNQILTIVCLTQ